NAGGVSSTMQSYTCSVPFGQGTINWLVFDFSNFTFTDADGGKHLFPNRVVHQINSPTHNPCPQYFFGDIMDSLVGVSDSGTLQLTTTFNPSTNGVNYSVVDKSGRIVTFGVTDTNGNVSSGTLG